MWRKEKIPEDWGIELIVRIPKKRNMAECLNWRGVALLMIVSKLLASIILERWKEKIYKKLRS